MKRLTCGSLAELDRTKWMELADGWPVELSYDWLRYEEGRVAARCVYLVVVDDTGRYLGAAVAYLFDGTGHHTAYPVHEVLLGASHYPAPAVGDRAARLRELAERLRARARFIPSLVCVSPSSYQPGLLWRRRSDLTEQSLVVEGVLDMFADASNAMGATASAVLFVPGTSTPLIEGLRRAGYHPARLGANSVLRLPFTSFDDYVLSLPPQRRRKVTRERARFAGLGPVIKTGGPELLDHDCAKLAAAHYRRYGHETSIPAVLDRFARIERQAPLRVVTASVDGRLVGFSAFLVDTGRFIGRMYGSDSGGYFEYFNLVYYEPIRLAIEDRVKEIQYGSETYDAKVFRGCQLTPLVGYFTSTDTGITMAVRVRDLAARTELAPYRERVSQP
jgi:predicted N-acyltransferase